MRIFFLTILMGSMLGISPSFAQIENKKGDVSGGIGFSTSNGFLSAVDGLVNGVSGITFQNTRSSGALFLGYKTPLISKLLVGCTFAYESINEDVYENDVQIGDLTSRYITVSFDVLYHYIDKEIFQMYSGVGIAYTSHAGDYTVSNNDIEDVNDGYFNFQVTGVGFRVGKAVAFSTELGFGFKGIANVGLSYQF